MHLILALILILGIEGVRRLRKYGEDDITDSHNWANQSGVYLGFWMDSPFLYD